MRRGRVSSRASSNRSSAILDTDHLHPGAYTSSHALRPVESRFSLNEQFAATRRDYEFGDDDASSILGRATTTTEDGDQDDTVVLDRLQPMLDPTAERSGQSVVLKRSYYELLCLPEDIELSAADIWKAYHRLFTILQPERQPKPLTPIAQSILISVQEAFRTLIEPYRKVAYDLSNHHSPAESESLELLPYDRNEATYEEGLREAYLNFAAGEIALSTDLGLRVDASPTPGSSRTGGERRWRAPNPVDLQLCQTTTLALPTLGKHVQKLVTSAEDFVESKLPDTKRRHGRIYSPAPILTVTGGVHGFLDEPYRLASVLTDRYQPPGPSIHGQRHLEQLIASRFLPVLNVRLRQEFATTLTRDQKDKVLPDTVLETEVAILPEAAITTRVAHAFDLPSGGHPVTVEVCVTKYGPASRSAPVVGLALHRRVASGTGFLTVDAGDWTLRPAEECLHFSKFSTLTKRFANTRNPFRSAPTVEVGYTVSSYELGLRPGRGFTRPADRGVRAMDMDLDDDPSGSWTVSAGATAETVAGYLRYGRDLFSLLSPSPSASLPPGNRNHRKSGFRAEAELGVSRSWLSGQQADYLALRALKRVGRFSRLGFEVGVSPSNLHLSFYWSRLGQRVNIPFLLATKSSMSTELVFWATVLPFLGFGVAEILSRRRATRKLKKKSREQDSRAKLQEYVARRRAEADELTVVLANGVEPRQKAERQAGGLVIMSAKYSVKGAPSDEVADVTVAVAALVDNGEVVIPKGLRKSHLLGFWDPAPLDTKVLFVRYLYQGKEYSVEVVGGQELRLPSLGR